MDNNEWTPMPDIEENYPYVEWTKEFENMDVEVVCPKCEWEPYDCNTIISYGPKKYSYYLSLLSSFSQYVWEEIHECPECLTIFKTDTESI